MSFFDSLRRTFIYSGEQDSDKEDKPSIDKKEFHIPRVDIKNPLRRIQDIRAEASNSIKALHSQENSVVTECTKSLIYEAFYNVVEGKVHKNKPLVEAKLLFKRFLDDEVTDEAMYSDEDLLYIKTLVGCVKELKSNVIPQTLNRDELLDKIMNSPYLLEMLELYEIYYHMGIMKYLCDSSYIICGYSYTRGTVVDTVKEKVGVPYFQVNIGNTVFYLLSEVKSLISDESSIDEKRAYISAKLKPMVKRFVVLNDIPIRALYPPYIIFDNWLGSIRTNNGNANVGTNDTEGESKVTENVTTESVYKSDLDVQEKMLNGILGDLDNPVNILKKDSDFVTLYGPLASPSNPDVDAEELSAAIKDIEEIIHNGIVLSPEEHRIYKNIKARFALLSDDGGV